MTSGYIVGNILGPLIVFGIMWYVGYRKQSQKIQRNAIIAFLAYECSFLFGILIALILFAVGFAIFFTCKSYLERKNTTENGTNSSHSTGDNKSFNNSNKDIPLNPSEEFADAFYKQIDAVWRIQNYPLLYAKVKNRQGDLEEFLYKKHKQLLQIPEYEQDPNSFEAFALLQCFSLSFIFACSLEKRFPGYSNEDVSFAMMQVIAEHYLRDEAVFDRILSFMIKDVNNIVALTLELLEER